MSLFSFFKKKKEKKVSIYKTIDSYKDILYSSKDESIQEVIFNRTNLKSPKSVKHKSGVTLYYNRPVSNSISNKDEIISAREIRYLTPEEFIANRSPLIKFYWNNNFDECTKRYSSYEEFFAISCASMNKPRIKVITNE